MSNKLFVGLILLCILSAGFAFFFYSPVKGGSGNGNVALVFPEPQQVNSYQLISATGESVNTTQWKGRWQFLYFGFTHCPDACPVALNHMRHIKQLLREHNFALDYAFISVDPRRDTPELLRQYVSYYDSEIKAYTAKHQILRKFSHDVGVVYKIQDQGGVENYLVDHSTFFVLLNPQQQHYAIFRLPHNAEKIASALMQILTPQ